METPPPPSSTRSNMSRITQRMLFSIIKHFPFEALFVPNRYTTDWEEDIHGFIGALVDALKIALLESVPPHLSPRKLIEPSGHLAYEPPTPTPTLRSMSRVVDAEEEEEDISLEPTPFMLRLRGVPEFEDEQKKQRMKIDATESKAKVEQDTAEEAHIGAEGFTSQEVNEGEIQDPTLSRPIDLESADDPVKLRKAGLRNMALAGFPLRHSANLVLADERPASSNLPPPPDLPFYSKLKPISPARRALMRDLMEEIRRTLHYNPYTLVDLGKEPNLGLPMVYVGKCHL